MKVVVFTGAGISAPLGLPTTDKFNIGFNTQFMNLLSSYLVQNKNDIEAILSTVEEFIDFGFIEKVCTTLTQNTQYGSSTNRPTYRDYYTQAKESLKQIKKEVYAKLSKFNDKSALTLYKTLFESIVKSYDTNQISYITTNYDLTFDKTIESYHRKFSFIQNIEEIFEDYFHRPKLGSPYYRYKEIDTGKPYFEYIKLHGSLDWHKDGGICKKSGTTTTPDDPDNMFIIYPGEKLIPDEEPFASMHHMTFKRMLEADIVIVIGFAFRDRTINYIFSNLFQNNTKAKIHIVNPLEIKQYPNDSKFPFFYDNFQNQIEYHQEPLEIAKPLSFLRQ